MADVRDWGTSEAPIEIKGSDDESEATRSPVVIYLIEEADDLIRHQSTASLLPAAAQNEDSSKPSAIRFHLHARQDLIETSLIANAGDKTPTPPNPKQSHVSGSNHKRSPGYDQQFISYYDRDGKLSEVIDRSNPRPRLKHAHEYSTQTLDNSQLTSPGSARGVAGELALETAEEAHRAYLDPTESDRTTSPSAPLAIEAFLLSIKQKIEEGHADYTDVNTDNQNEASTDNEDIGDVQASPSYKHYITITQNLLVIDNRRLHFEPHFGQYVNNEEASGLGKRKEMLDKPAYPQASRRAEYICQLNECLPKILEELELNREDLASYIMNMKSPAESSEVSTGPIAYFLSAFKKIFNVEMQDVMLELAELSKAERRQSVQKVIGSAEQLLQPHLMACPVCQVHRCGIHGGHESDNSVDSDQENRDNAELRGVYESDSDDSDGEEKCKTEKYDIDYADMNVSFKSLLDRQNERCSRSKEGTSISKFMDGRACSLECFTVKDGVRNECSEWTIDNITWLQALIIGVENEPRASCVLSPVLMRPCYDVHKVITSFTSKPWNPAQAESTQKGKLDWYDNKQKKIRGDLDWGKKTKTHLHHQRYQPTGCEHPGLTCNKAKGKCRCFRHKVLCDKFCACADDCYMKFTGCNCSQSGFPCSQNSLTCPCQLLNRECDPDLCHTCGAALTANPFTHDQELTSHCCQNTDIQRGVRKNLLVGESCHPNSIGCGAYTAEPIKRGDFIAEYVGEIISYGEVARRDNSYEKSFFFDLNKELAIDSYRYGNIERFINHSVNNENCKPIVKLVNGAHRIGFFALKDLDAGTELWFDYGKEFVRKNGLTDFVFNGKGEAVKEAGGIDKIQEVRRKTSRSRGRKGSLSRRRHSLKQAYDIDPEFDDELDAFLGRGVFSYHDGGDEGDEYEEEEKGEQDGGKPRRRRKRLVRRPVRYTL